MFSGIVETTAQIVRTTPGSGVLQIHAARPSTFQDIAIGDSIAVNGCCLTVEAFDEFEMTFALGPETLRITGWSPNNLIGKNINLERSLRLNDRIHGHLVTGHVDAVANVCQALRQGDTFALEIELPNVLRPFIWSKGSVAINGVSLTVNAVSAQSFALGLIPETLKRTNLGELQPGMTVNLEIDNMARGLVRWAELRHEDQTV